MAITWRLEYVLSSHSLAVLCPTSDDENVRRSMKEARLLSERASERASDESVEYCTSGRGKRSFCGGFIELWRS